MSVAVLTRANTSPELNLPASWRCYSSVASLFDAEALAALAEPYLLWLDGSVVLETKQLESWLADLESQPQALAAVARLEQAHLLGLLPWPHALGAVESADFYLARCGRYLCDASLLINRRRWLQLLQQQPEASSVFELLLNTTEPLLFSTRMTVKASANPSPQMLEAWSEEEAQAFKRLLGSADSTLALVAEARLLAMRKLGGFFDNLANLATGRKLPREQRLELLFGALEAHEKQADQASINEHTPIEPVVKSIEKQLRQWEKEFGEEPRYRRLAERMGDFSYQFWRQLHRLRELDGLLFAEHINHRWQRETDIHVVLWVQGNEQEHLGFCLHALQRQAHAPAQLSVVADRPRPPHFPEALHWVEASAHGYVRALQELLRHSSQRWVLVCSARAFLADEALLRLMDYAQNQHSASLVYSDHGYLDQAARPVRPSFKPDFALDTLRAQSYLGAVALMERSWLLTQRDPVLCLEQLISDTAFRMYESHGSSAIAHVPEPLYHLFGTDPSELAEGHRRSVSAHLQRLNAPAQVLAGYFPEQWRTEWAYPSDTSVCVVVLSRDKSELLEPLLSNLFERTGHLVLEVLLVNHASEEPETADALAEQQAKYPQRLKVLDLGGPFHPAHLLNQAIATVHADVIVVMDNDTQIVGQSWLERLLCRLADPGIGIVGARLAKAETTRINHGGFVLGAGNYGAGVIDSGHIDRPGPLACHTTDRNVSAVSLSFMAFKRQLWLDLKGFDTGYQVMYADVDFCLRCQQAGYRVLWTPYVNAVHQNGYSLNGYLAGDKLSDEAIAIKRAVFYQDGEYFLQHWYPVIGSDPFYPKHYSLAKIHQVSMDVIINWDTRFRDRPRCYALPLSGGSGDYRVIDPFDALSQAGMAQCEYVRLGRLPLIGEIKRLEPDSFSVHSVMDEYKIDLLKKIKRYDHSIFRLYMLDDLVTQIPDKSSAKASNKRHFPDARRRLREAVGLCDRAIVSTEPLRQLLQPLIDDIVVLPNTLPTQRWLPHYHPKSIGPKGKKRVGWVGALQHQGDLDWFADVVTALADEVQWVFMGMTPPGVQSLVEFHIPVEFSQYPQTMASLDLDLAVAPLEIHPFNEAKSNLRLLEYGILGWPVVATDIFPYQTNQPPISRVNNDVDTWVHTIRTLVHEPEELLRQSQAIHQWVRDNYLLENHLDTWLKALLPPTRSAE